jgi:hypothetical protein
MTYQYTNDGGITKNGGSWTYGSEYAQGWFWSVAKGQQKRNSLPSKQSHNVTLVGTGEVLTPDNAINLDFDSHGNVTESRHYVLQKDGTYVTIV